MKKRCAWVPVGDVLYENYHDTEWGVPVYSDQKLFEFLVLESAQAGLSWRTILARRDGYRKAFANFNPKKVALFTTKDIHRLLTDTAIIRNRAKIEATVNNAKKFLEIKKEFGTFSNYMWGFVGGKPIQNHRTNREALPAISRESELLARDLKSRGFKFLGPTIMYAHMQAVGMVNDHRVDCFRCKEVRDLYDKNRII